MAETKQENAKEVILDEISILIQRCYGISNWNVQKAAIIETLDKLDPIKPKDGSTYEIAFNVAEGKPKQKTKMGRFIVKKLGLLDLEVMASSGITYRLDNQTLEYLAGRINIRLFGVEKFTILRGADITRAYAKNVGTGSCMTGCCCEYTLLYEMNPKKIGLLVMYAGNNTARAVFHTLDNGHILVDRAYSNCELLKERIHEFAIKNGYFYHLHGEIMLGDKPVKDQAVLDSMRSSGLKYHNGGVPYMDTLYKGTIEHNLLTISYGNGDFTLDSTCGEIEDYIRCEDCNESVYSEEAYYVDSHGYVCRECYCDAYFICVRCCAIHDKLDGYKLSGQTGIHICGSCRCYYMLCMECNRYTRPIEFDKCGKCFVCMEKENGEELK